MASSSPTSVVSTDSYPTNFRSYSTDLNDDGIHSIDSERPVPNEDIPTLPATVPKLKWDKEQFDVRRPYERKNYERPFRDLPGHLSNIQGLNVKPRKCTVPNPFARRTPIEEVFHKRNVKSVCPAEEPRALVDCVEDVIVADNPSHQIRASSVESYQPPTIMHRDDKAPVIEAQDEFLQRIRSRYLQKFDRVRKQLEDAERERQKPPAPFDAEKYEAEYPEPDIRNEAKALFRQALRNRLEEINQLQSRTVRRYPTSVKQFAAYKAQIMEDRRKLRDEALLVEDYFRKANTPKELPEAKLEVKRYRTEEFGVHPDDSEDEKEREENEQNKRNEPLVYHTCMTREEWGHWIAHSTKIEKLKLPKVTVPRIPVLVQTCEESPIRLYVQGALRDGKSQEFRRETTPKELQLAHPEKIIHSIPPSATRKSKVTMRDLLFDPASQPEPMDYVPYNASIRPYSDIAEEQFRSVKGQRKVRRQLRKSRMHWIEEIVDEICSRKRY
uniref:Uncharacterized protein n=1 Tax=Anopheles minimus TaxID=112268 RepID=A0A182WEH9_9DIPT